MSCSSIALVDSQWSDFIASVCTGYRMVHEQCQAELCAYLVNVLGLGGDVVECGCFKGETSLVIAKVLRRSGKDKQLHVYDSFEGVPTPTALDAGTTVEQGEARASVHDVEATFKGAGERLPVIHAGWFSETIPDELPERICFAFLDGDFYDSIRVCIEGVFPRLVRGGVVYVHDYGYCKLPGVKKAVDAFVRVTPNAFVRTSARCAAIVSRGF